MTETRTLDDGTEQQLVKETDEDGYVLRKWVEQS